MKRDVAPPIVGFLGLSHLGVITSTVMSSLGVKTICFDLDKSLTEELSQGASSISEPGLKQLLNSNSRRQTFTSCILDLKECDFVYVSCDVPTNTEGISDTLPVERLILLIRSNLPDMDIVVLSQVHPGFTRNFADLTSGHIYYQVETLVFGKAIERSLNQTRIIVGSRNANDKLPKAYLQILKLYKCPIFVFSYETAELVKVAINSFLASDVTLTNTLAELSEEIHAEWEDIVNALVLDERIGRHRYLKPGLGISGGNIERDLNTLVELSTRVKINDSLLKTIIDVNLHHRRWVVRKLHKYGLLDPIPRIFGILGLSYKKDTNSTKNSPAISLIEELPRNSKVLVFDPVVKSLEKPPKMAISFEKSALEVFRRSDVILIMTPWDEFSSILDSNYHSHLKDKVIIDPFGVLKRESGVLGLRKYVTIGAVLK